MTVPAPQRLPVMQVIVAAFRLPVQMWSTLWPAVQWPLSLLVFMQGGGAVTGGATPEAMSMLLLFSLLGLAITAMVAVPAHQIFIRGDVREGHGGIRWGARETAYFGWSLGLPAIVLVLASLVSMPLVAIAMGTNMGGFANLAVLAGLLVGVAVYGRFSMVLPRVALGLKGGLRAASAMAKGHYWRIGVIGVVFPLVISLVPVFLQTALGLPGVVLAILAGVYFSVVQIAALSLVYRWLLEYEAPARTEADDETDRDDSDRLD